MKKSLYKWSKEFIILFFASVIYGIGIMLLDTQTLAAGGVSGLAIIISHFTGVSTGLIVLIINVPIIIIGIYKFGIKFLITTIFAIVVSSFAIDIFAVINPFEMDLIATCASGSVLVAVGIGIIFRMGATTGGTDIIVKLLKLKLKHVKSGVIFLAVDIFVVILSGITLGNAQSAVYAGICVFIQSYVINLMLYGTDGAGMVYIISNREEEIAQRLINELNLGVTFFEGYGGYSGDEKKILMSTARKKILPSIRTIVLEEDAEAFMIVANASEVMGEGFKRLDKEEI